MRDVGFGIPEERGLRASRAPGVSARSAGQVSAGAIALLGGVALIAGLAAARSDSGLPAWVRLRSDLERAEARVAELEQSIAALEREREALENDSPLAIERAIREDLGLARPGEVVVVWPDARGAAATPGRRLDTRGGSDG